MLEIKSQHLADVDHCMASKHLRKIGILGGTFNPPHYAHLEMARDIYREFDLEQVVLLPCGDPPHKRKEQVANKFHRYNMLCLLIKDIPFLSVSDVEIVRLGVTYTVDTMQILREKYLHKARLYYIIGTDTLLTLESWRDYQKVFSMTSFICVMRPGDSPLQVKNKIEYFQKQYHLDIQLADSMGLNISSTMVREKFLRGEDITDYTSREIEEYMENNDVYERK